MATVTLYGASDDLIEIEGDIEEEFYYTDGNHYVAFSNGTVVKIIFDDDGIWRITPYLGDTDSVHIVQTDGRDDGTFGGYTDIATITGDITWVVVGERVGRA